MTRWRRRRPSWLKSRKLVVSRRPLLPRWVPRCDRRRIDDDELAGASTELARELDALARELGCYTAAYRRGAPDVPRGLCFFYRAARLTQSQLNRLHASERRLGDVVFVAYQRPLTRFLRDD